MSGKRSVLSHALDYLVELYMVVAPQNAMSMLVKRRLLTWRGARIGTGVKIWRDVWIDDYAKLSVGEAVTIGKSVMLICGGGVTLGHRVMIGHGAKIISGGHQIPDGRETPMRWSGAELSTVSIAEDAWIGAGAIILPGVTVGRGAVVAAGAVVSNPVPEYAIVGGVPARLIRQRT